MAHDAPPGERSGRRFLERPTAILGLIGTSVGIAVGGLALVHALTGGGDDLAGRQARIRACVSDHGLARAVVAERANPGQLLFRRCTWPPPTGADPDGFTEITVTRGPGPGRSEAEGLTVADVYASSCPRIEARYLFNSMGTFEPAVAPVRLARGEVRRVENGAVWHPRTAQEASIYTPHGDQATILSNSRYRPDSVTCAGTDP
jgi:hypothetical protein